MTLRDQIVAIIRRLEQERPGLSYHQMLDVAVKEAREAQEPPRADSA